MSSTKGVERAFSFKLCDVLKTVLVVNYEHVMVGQNPDFTGIFSHIVKKHTKMGLLNAMMRPFTGKHFYYVV